MILRKKNLSQFSKKDLRCIQSIVIPEGGMHSDRRLKENAVPIPFGDHGVERVAMTVDNPPSITVLIVEDDNISRSALSWLLKELGFQSIAVGDLAAAREVLGRITPHIMILDLILPDGNGIDLLAEIRNARRPIMVAVVTGITDELRNFMN